MTLAVSAPSPLTVTLALVGANASAALKSSTASEPPLAMFRPRRRISLSARDVDASSRAAKRSCGPAATLASENALLVIGITNWLLYPSVTDANCVFDTLATVPFTVLVPQAPNWKALPKPFASAVVA